MISDSARRIPGSARRALLGFAEFSIVVITLRVMNGMSNASNSSIPATDAGRWLCDFSAWNAATHPDTVTGQSKA